MTISRRKSSDLAAITRVLEAVLKVKLWEGESFVIGNDLDMCAY